MEPPFPPRATTKEAGFYDRAAPLDLSKPSKESFLDILRRGSTAPSSSGAAGQAGAGPSFLQDDFMVGRRSKVRHPLTTHQHTHHHTPHTTHHTTHNTQHNTTHNTRRTPHAANRTPHAAHHTP